MVDAQIQRWTLTNDDIYLLKFHEEPPQWLEDMIENIVVDIGLVDDIGDLEDRFNNFEEGYTEHFYDWREGDRHTLAYVETIYTTNSTFNAGLQEIKVAYVSKNEAGAYFDNLIGAWQTGAGGAWFNERVSVVSNVAYSAAKSVSTLTATMTGQQDQLDAIVGDIEIIQDQVDGKVETWADTHPVVNPDGSMIVDAEPYATWLANNTLAEHTGDTYIHYEIDGNGNEQLLGTYRFIKDENDVYKWSIFTDDLASKAYEQALAAGALADGKINSYYQTYPPTSTEDPTLGEGDIWLDSDDGNKMYRYTGTQWIPVRDVDISASVNRLDEATVTIDGKARAKSSLVVDADGVTSGYVAEADNSTWSTFNIYADKFYVSGQQGSGFSTAPFSIDTTVTPTRIKFNGVVDFENVNGSDDVLLKGGAASDVNRYSTTIDGGKITTYSLNANRIAADTIWARGSIKSADYDGPDSGYIGSDDPNGFILNGKAGAGTYNKPNIYGGYIRGGTIAATVIKYNGAKWESSTGWGYGKSSYADVKQGGTDSGEYTSEQVGLVGPSWGEQGGYQPSRILSRYDSVAVVTINASMTVDDGTHWCVLQVYTPSRGWMNMKSRGITHNGGNTSAWYPSIQWLVNFWYMDDDDRYMKMRVHVYSDSGNTTNVDTSIMVQLNN